MGGVMTSKGCTPSAINGIEDHTHFIFYLHPSVSLASLVKDIKLSSSSFINKHMLFPHFAGWQSGYAAFTYASEAYDNLVNYVARQEIHHKRYNSKEELRALLREHGIKYDERYFE